MKRTEPLAIALVLAAACGQRTGRALAHRAHVASHDSDQLTVIGLDRMEIAGRVATRGVANHMAEVSADLSRIYVDSEETDEAVVVDTRRPEVTDRSAVGCHPTHANPSEDGKLLDVDEDEGVGGAVSFLVPQRNVEMKRLGGDERQQLPCLVDADSHEVGPAGNDGELAGELPLAQDREGQLLALRGPDDGQLAREDEEEVGRSRASFDGDLVALYRAAK